MLFEWTLTPFCVFYRSLLAAACEGQSILLFDPFNGRLIGEKSKAHTDCVNIVK